MKRLLWILVLVGLANNLRATEAQVALPAPEKSAQANEQNLATPPAKPKKVRKRGEPAVRTGGLFGELAKEKQPLKALDPRQPANPRQDARNVSTNSFKPPTAGFKLLTFEF